MIQFDGKLTVLRLMNWIEKNSENRIRLPELPHIEVESQEEYYKKKAVLESYEENYDKTEIEIDDMINMDFYLGAASGQSVSYSSGSGMPSVDEEFGQKIDL